jgi:hypothetical protein
MAPHARHGDAWSRHLSFCDEVDDITRQVCGSRNGVVVGGEEGEYKVDGDADDIEQEGACIGVHFDGAIYKNGVKYGTVVLNWEVDTFEHEGTYCNITLVDEDNEEELSGLEETCLEEFHDFYEFPDNMAYRE